MMKKRLVRGNSMIDYVGIDCPVCKKVFTEADDIVVCPKCGAPYHRSCYMEKGECVFHDLHEQGKSWEAPVPERPKTTTSSEIKDKECIHCGVLNAHSAIFCSSCGESLSEPATHANRPPYGGNPINFNQPIYGMGGMQGPFDPMGGVSAGETADENISFGELSKVVQQGTSYYMPVFSRISKQKKSKFNFVAFLFSGGWLLYRKQYVSGIIVTVSMILLYLAQTFFTIFVTYEKMISMLEELGSPISGQGVTTEQIMLLSANMSGIDLLIMCVPLFIFLAMVAIMITVGFTANRRYYKHCIKTVNKTRKSCTNTEDYETRIQECGGVNTMVTICVLVCMFICMYLPNFFIGII